MLHAVVRSSILAFALVGCSLTTSLGGFSDGTAVVGDQDSPAPSDTTAPEQARTDRDPNMQDTRVSLPEKGATPDPQPPGSSTFCSAIAPRPTSCVDFEGAPELGDWTKITGNGGEVVVTSEAGRSKAVEVRIVNIVNPSNDAAAAISRSVTSAKPKTVVFSLDLRILARNPSKKYDLLTIDFASNNGIYELQLEQDNAGQLTLVEKIGSAETPRPLAGLTLGAGPDAPWTHITWTIQIGSSATVKVDNTSVSTTLSSAVTGVANPMFVVGDNKQNDLPYTVRFDDIMANVAE